MTRRLPELAQRILELAASRPGAMLEPGQVAQELEVDPALVYHALGLLVQRGELVHPKHGPYWKSGQVTPGGLLIDLLATLGPGNPIPDGVLQEAFHTNPSDRDRVLAWLRQLALVETDSTGAVWSATTLGALAARPWVSRGHDRRWRAHVPAQRGAPAGGQDYVVAATRLHEVAVFALDAGGTYSEGRSVVRDRAAAAAVRRGYTRTLRGAVGLFLRPTDARPRRRVTVGELPAMAVAAEPAQHVYVLGVAPEGGLLIYCDQTRTAGGQFLVVRAEDQDAVVLPSADPLGEELGAPIARIRLSELQLDDLRHDALPAIEAVIAQFGADM
jgi:hypothetical protein